MNVHCNCTQLALAATLVPAAGRSTTVPPLVITAVPPHVFDAIESAMTPAGSVSVMKKPVCGDVLTLKIVSVKVNGEPADMVDGVNALFN